MTRHVPDDRRFMSFEQRAADDPKFRGKVERDVPAVETCFCGKTVVKARGVPTGWTCPRECEKDRP